MRISACFQACSREIVRKRSEIEHFRQKNNREEAHGGPALWSSVRRGIKQGFVYGRTADERPCRTVTQPVEIDQIHQTIYHALGIPPDTHYEVEGRPFYTTPTATGSRCWNSSHDAFAPRLKRLEKTSS